MEDLNAKISKESNSEIGDKFGVETRNEHEGKWVQWCMVNDQIIANT